MIYVYDSVRLSQVKPDQADSDDAIALNKEIRALKAVPTQRLKLPKLDMGSVTIRTIRNQILFLTLVSLYLYLTRNLL